MAFYRKLDRFSQIQLISGMRALADGNITIDESNENDIGIVVGTSDGPMTEIVGFQKAVVEGALQTAARSPSRTQFITPQADISAFSPVSRATT